MGLIKLTTLPSTTTTTTTPAAATTAAGVVTLPVKGTTSGNTTSSTQGLTKLQQVTTPVELDTPSNSSAVVSTPVLDSVKASTNTTQTGSTAVVSTPVLDSVKNATSSTASQKQLLTMPVVLDTPTNSATSEEDTARTWFQKGATEDGVNLQNILKAASGTVVDAAQDVATGLASMPEKVADTAASLVGALGKLTKQQGVADAAQDYITGDAYDEKQAGNVFLSALASGLTPNNPTAGLGLTKVGNFLSTMKTLNSGEVEEDSVLGEKSDALAQSGGQFLGTAALSLAGVPMWATNATTSFGGEMESALRQGATMEQALASSAVTAAAETLTEQIGGYKFGGQTLSGKAADTLTKNVSNKVANALINLGVDAAGEGLEEILSGAISAVGQKLTYMSDQKLSELFSKEDALESFIGGAVLGFLGGTGNLAGNTQSGTQGTSGTTQTALPPLKSTAQTTQPVTQTTQQTGRTPVLDSVKQNTPVQEVTTLPKVESAANVDQPVLLPTAVQKNTASEVEAGEYRAVKPQNVELPTVPIINLSMQSVADLNGGEMPTAGNYVRKSAFESAKKRLGLDQSEAVHIEASNITRNGDAYVIKITKPALNKMLSASSYESGVVPLESIAVLEQLERIAQNGVYYNSEGDRNGRPQIAGYDYLKTTVYIDGTPFEVNMRVRVDDEMSGGGNRLYHFTPEAIEVAKKNDGETSTAGRHATSIKSEETPSSDPMVAQTLPGVKSQDMQNDAGVFLPGGGGTQGSKKSVVNDLREMIGQGDTGKLRQYVSGQEQTASAQTNPARPGQELMQRAHERGLSVEEYLRENWDEYEYDGKPNEEAQAAQRLEQESIGTLPMRVGQTAKVTTLPTMTTEQSEQSTFMPGSRLEQTNAAEAAAETKTSREDIEQLRQKDLDDHFEMVRQVGDVLEQKTDPADKVSTEAGKKKKTLKESAKDAWSLFKRKIVDSGEAVTRVGKAVGDKSLYHFYNMARASSNAATSMILENRTDIYGRSTGKGLNQVLEGVRSKGEEYYRNFQMYLYHMHNVDRMSRYSQENVDAAEAAFAEVKQRYPELKRFTDSDIERMTYEETGPYYFEASEYTERKNALQKAKNTVNKPVFGYDVTAQDSQDAANQLLRENPEFEAEAKEVYAYIDNLLRYRVDSGLITEKDYQNLKGTYPHYVPTFRTFERQNNTDKRQKGKMQIGSTIKTATGSSEKLMPLHKALAQQTMSVVREGSKNRFGQRLLNSGAQKAAADQVYRVQEYQSNVNEDNFDQPEDTTFQKNNTFIVREDGKLWEMEVSPAMYEAVKALSPDMQETNALTNVVRKSNDLFKKLVTGYNPTFLVRNFMRDLQDAGLYSKDLSEFAKQYPQAVAEIKNNGEYWQQYKALGGTYSTVFDYETGDVEQGSKLKQKTVDRLEALNQAIEQAPRLAEFMATVKKAEKSGGVTMETLMEGMYNAADVTVNFGRSGTLGKVLNANFVPFLNPGIQGFDKMVRTVTETKGAKDWARLAVKAAVLGVAPALFNGLLYEDDEEWDSIKDRDKDVYYLFKLQDGLWLKLPKGRTLSVLGAAANRITDTIQGEDADWGGFINTALTQTAPANPLEENILKAWFDADLFDADSPGTTWYGTDIEPQRLQNYAPGERYDEKTDVVSKWLGEKLNLSPKKINYLLDQYSGVVGDALLPLLTPTAERDMFTAAFTLDTTTSNRLSNDFYEMADDLTYAKNAPEGTGADAVAARYWTKQTSAVSEVNAVIRKVEADESLSNKEKKELAKAQYEIRNGIMQNALNTYEEYAAAAQKYYQASTLEDEDDRVDEAYREANREVLGAEYALKAYNKDVHATAQQMLEEVELSYDDSYDFYFERQKANDSLSGTEKSNAVRDLIREMDATEEQKIALYEKYVSSSRTDDIEAFAEVGLSMDEFLRVHNKYAEINETGENEATEFAYWVNSQGYSSKQAEVIKDCFKYYYQIPSSADRYDDFVGIGLESDDAYGLTQAISELEPESGKTSVSNVQKWRAVVDYGLDVADQMTALQSLTTESQYNKFVTANDYGVTPEKYVAMQEILPKFDANGNGSYTNAEIKSAIDSVGTSGLMLPGSSNLLLSNEQKAVLWQLLTGSKSAKNNPYSASVGEKVLAGAEEKTERVSHIFSLTGNG